MWYALESPSGHLIEGTVAIREEVWVKAFQHLCSVIPGFGDKYWKRERASKEAARRLGWKIVKVAIVKIPEASR